MLKSGQTETDMYQTDIKATEDSLPTIRSLAGSWLLARGFSSEIIHDAKVVANELATNAIQWRPNSTLTLHLSLCDGCPKIGIWDESKYLPRASSMPTDDDESGRGLIIVASLAIDYGVQELVSGGKVVWAILPKE